MESSVQMVMCWKHHSEKLHIANFECRKISMFYENVICYKVMEVSDKFF